ncbi:hypothetical protein cyc_08422 [Cyclospora cayetanensis]|uniref:Uncharacterized protein n=1 Tax=Cyclospora cayetanensis TaxID=88456 RepID=A0A1D3DA87_9EIME|nr:hypothetical protein cyc_08422 [Cyclospora cayetanensis]
MKALGSNNNHKKAHSIKRPGQHHDQSLEGSDREWHSHRGVKQQTRHATLAADRFSMRRSCHCGCKCACICSVLQTLDVALRLVLLLFLCESLALLLQQHQQRLGEGTGGCVERQRCLQQERHAEEKQQQHSAHSLLERAACTASTAARNNERAVAAAEGGDSPPLVPL